MAEIKHREDNPIPGVDYSEIHIPDEHDLGTGKFTTMVPEKTFSKMNPVISNVMHDPYFLLIISINLGIDQVTAVLGKTHDEPPISRKVFNIPKDFNVEDAHEFTVSFKEWDVTEMKLNGKEMEIAE